MSRFAFVTLLTAVRAPLVFAGAALALVHLFAPHPAWLAGALALMGLSAVTDLFDGALARRWGVTSRLGALADPLMDKVFYLVATPVATFAALYNEDVAHASVLLALDVASLFRDQWASFLRSVGSEFGADVKASFSGKLRTFLAFPILMAVHLQLGLQSLAMRSPAHEGAWQPPMAAVYALEGLLLALVVVSGATYTARFRPYLRRAARPAGRA